MKSFAPLFLIVVCIAAFYMYLKPAYADILKLREQKVSYDDVLQKAKEIIQKRDTILNEYNSLPEEDRTRLEKFLPEKFDNVLMANHINSIANKHGMVIQDVILSTDSPSQEQNTGLNTINYKTHVVSFFVVGKYETFIPFLKDLELNLDLVDITKLTIDGDSKNPKSQNFQFNVVLKTYSLN